MHYQIYSPKRLLRRVCRTEFEEKKLAGYGNKFFYSLPKIQQVMKFSTILTSVLFALFTLTATATLAGDVSTTSNQKVQTLELEKGGGYVVTVFERTLQVSPDANRMASPEPILVKVMQGLTVVAQDSNPSGSVSLDLADLNPGSYMVMIISDSGTVRKLVNIQ